MIWTSLAGWNKKPNKQIKKSKESDHNEEQKRQTDTNEGK